jgi:hypothetical protein
MEDMKGVSSNKHGVMTVNGVDFGSAIQLLSAELLTSISQNLTWVTGHRSWAAKTC